MGFANLFSEINASSSSDFLQNNGHENGNGMEKSSGKDQM